MSVATSTIPTSPSLQKTSLVDRTFNQILQWDQEALMNNAAPSLASYLVMDVLSWAEEDLNWLTDQILNEIFEKGVPKKSYQDLMVEVSKVGRRYIGDDHVVLAVVIVRHALTQVFFNNAAK